jgi:hypothetical protein
LEADDRQYCGAIAAHYERSWSRQGTQRRWELGPTHDLPGGFHVLEFSECERRRMWTYASVCMSQRGDESRVELHIHSPSADESHVELLAAIAHYHRTGSRLGLGHTVNFGRPWMAGSKCSYGLASLPYMDGPRLGSGVICGIEVRFLWLVPITRSEMEFKKRMGLAALEGHFEAKELDYLDPTRPSVV